MEGNRHTCPEITVLNKRNPKRTTASHIIMKMVQVKDKEAILKAARMKTQVTYKGHPIGYQLIVMSNFTSQKTVAQDISRADRKESTT